MENNVLEDDSKFHCKECNYKCKFEYIYNRHLKTNKHINGKITRIHTKEPTNYKCEKCDFISNHIYNYKSHILNNHSSIEERKKEFPHYCELCDYGIFSKDLFDKHLLTKKHFMKSK